MIKKKLPYLKQWNASHLLAVLFLVYIFYMALAGFPGVLENTVSALGDRVAPIALIDSQYEDMLDTDPDRPLLHNKGTYINLNGLAAKVMGQPMVNDRITLTNGHLTAVSGKVYSDQELQQIARNICTLWQQQVTNGKHFLFIMTPTQIDVNGDLLPSGYEDHTNDNADRLLALLEAQGVPCLDLRAVMAEEGIHWSDAFYRTDHHWTTQTGFWAYGQIIAKLHAMGAVSHWDSAYTDPDNFEFRIYEDAFLGSSGKRTGRYYAGVDDFCLIIPKFETSLSVTIPERNLDICGTFLQTAYHEDALAYCESRDFFNGNPYGLYGWGDPALTHWRNGNAPDRSKCMLIGDSFGNVPFSLMSLYFQTVDELDMRHYTGNFAAHHAALDPDILILEINPGTEITDQTMYPFFPDLNS